jgi:transposase InsO family protein
MAKNKIFPLNIAGEKQALKASFVDDNWLWHHRYGHLNFRSLKFLGENNLVDGLPLIQHVDALCESCVFGKHHRNVFPKGEARRASKQIELVHVDVCGPMRTPSLNNRKYFIVFVDDYSRMTWVYFAKEKSEVFSIFKKFKNQVEKQSGNSLKILQTDRGGEFLSKEFDSFCEDFGIFRQLTASYTPQQNGVAERKNRSIVEMAKSMLKAKGIPNSFWAEAVHTAAYLLNRSPTSALQHQTPFEAWHGWRPKVTHFKIFGCIAYVHVPSQKRHKLEDNSVKCIFMGYSMETKGYRCYDPLTKKLIVSRDVLFDEKNAWNWNKQQQFPLTIQEDDNLVDEIVEHEGESCPSNPSSPFTPRNNSSSSSGSSSFSSPESPPRKVKDLREIYEQGERCHFTQVNEPRNFLEAVQDKEWCVAMDEEIKALEKNKT